jgi:hypothetical protein
MIFLQRMKIRRGPTVAWMKTFRLFLPLGLLLATNISAQNQCRTEMAEAESRYSEGRFDETIAIVNR